MANEPLKYTSRHYNALILLELKGLFLSSLVPKSLQCQNLFSANLAGLRVALVQVSKWQLATQWY